jgi:hypothetical protein
MTGGTDMESPFLNEEERAFGSELGKKALAKDWQGVHSMLAPWMRSAVSVDDVRAFFEDEYRQMMDEWEVKGELRYPEYPDPELGGNRFTKATQLREPISWEGGRVRFVPPEVTDENVKYWMMMQLLCSDSQMEELGFDYFCEVWMAVVDTPEGLRVGYWSQGAY